jgi:UDP-GlcNAc:undecaprenyl-phosphate/decaprenyl-phosphate GlcNAc-1-phosphate transferase
VPAKEKEWRHMDRILLAQFPIPALTTALLSFAVGACCTFTILRLALRLPWLARSSSNRLHVAPTPVWGGMAIFSSFMVVAAIRGLFYNEELAAAAICASGVFLLGLVDDIWKLRPGWKLIGQSICSAVSISFVIRHPLTGNRPIDMMIAFLWMVGITNAFNLLDNINGLSAGTAVLVSALQTIFFLEHGEPARALASVAFCGAIVGFLIFNFPKGRIFMGDSGSLFIGFWLATSSLTGTQFAGKNRFGTLLFPLLIMVVPICDTILVTLTRILRGHPISQGGTDHVSHRLIAYGFTPKSAVLTLWAFTLLSGGLGYFAVFYEVPPVLSAVVFLMVALALFGTYLARFELHVQNASPRAVVQRPGVARWVRVFSRVLFDLVLIAAVYYTAYLVRFDGSASRADMHLLAASVLEVALIKLGVFVAFGVYRPWWDYFGLKDAYHLVAASALASLTTLAYLSVVYRFYGFSRVVFALDFLVFTMLALIFRFSFRLFDEIAPANHRTNVLIYGANSEGESVLQFVSKHHRFRVVGFLDDDHRKRHFSIHSVPIRGGTQDLACLTEQWHARAILLTPSASEEVKAKLLALCSALGIKLMRLNLNIEELALPASSIVPEVSVKRSLLVDEGPQPVAKALSKAGTN